MEFPAMISHFGDVPEEFPLSWVNNNVGILDEKLDTVKRLLSLPVDDDCFNEAIGAIHFIIDKVPLMVMRLGEVRRYFGHVPIMISYSVANKKYPITLLTQTKYRQGVLTGLWSRFFMGH